jgi:hypothetical protein
VTYKTGSGLDDLIYCHLIHTTRDYKQYSVIADLHTLPFTVKHALGFSVFISRILATDLYQSHYHFKSHMKSSSHSLSSFFPLFCKLPIPKTRLNSIPLLPSLCPGRLASRNTTPLYSTPARFGTLPYKPFARTTQETQPLYCWEGMFTATLHSNGSYLIVACLFVAAGICLPSRCLAMNVHSDFAIPAIWRHVTLRTHISLLTFKIC